MQGFSIVDFALWYNGTCKWCRDEKDEEQNNIE